MLGTDVFPANICLAHSNSLLSPLQQAGTARQPDLSVFHRKHKSPQLIISDGFALLKCKLLQGVRIHRENPVSKEHECTQEEHGNINSTQGS